MGGKTVRHASKREKPGAEICVIGLGYVGTRLAAAFDTTEHSVTGYDIDTEKIRTLQAGADPTGETSSAVLEEGDITFTDDPNCISYSDYAIIAIPTPVSESNAPDMSIVRAAGRTTGDNLSPGTTVVLESTVYPGATREVLIPELEGSSGLVAGEDFTVGYSPERVVPGDSTRDLQDIVKVVSAQDQETLADLKELYESIIEAGVHEAPTMETAEAAKCLENTQRDVNIALVNEFTVACHRSDANMEPDDVLAAAGTKWNFHDYRPGLVGGHCVPVDPYFLIHSFETHECSPTLMRAARNVNESVPKYVAEVTASALEQRTRPVVPGKTDGGTSTDRVLIAGLAYKPNTGDIRTSPVSTVIDHLRDRDLEVVGVDPHCDRATTIEEFDVTIQEELSVSGFDALVVPTPHDEYIDLDLERVSGEMNDRPVFVDVKGAFDGDTARDADFVYRRL